MRGSTSRRAALRLVVGMAPRMQHSDAKRSRTSGRSRVDGVVMNLGRVFGIRIQLHWSWLVIFTLLTLSLAGGVLPAWHPAWSPSLRWAVAIAACLLFFASILIHELAHSLVARARGLPVRRILLFLFGGVSNIERDPPSARDEFLITIVGPLTSFAVGIVCVSLGTVVAGREFRANPAAAVADLSPLATLLMWLGPVNLLLAAFNLVPGFPLDGGRVLRAILWATTHDLRRATRWAALVGRVVAMLFVIAGAAMLFGFRVPVWGAGSVNGLWLLMIGWFLYDAAVASVGQMEMKEALEDVPVARIMRRRVPEVSPDLPVSELVEHWMLQGEEERAFPVMEGDHLEGIVTLEDVRRTPRERWNDLRVVDIMTPERDLEVVEEGTAAGEALGKLLRGNLEQLPVVEKGHLEGIVRRADILRCVELRAGNGHERERAA